MSLFDKINDYLLSQSKAQLTKGKRIASSIDFIDIDDEDDFVVDVPSESDDFSYEVEFSFDPDFDVLTIVCECAAYDNYDDCKHCVAAAMAVQDFLLEQPLEAAIPPQKKQVNDEDGYFHFEMDRINSYLLRELAGSPTYTA